MKKRVLSLSSLCLGLLATGALAASWKQGGVPPCFDDGCAKVATSAFATPFGVPLAWIGLTYQFMWAVALFSITPSPRLRSIWKALSLIAVFISIGLVSVSVFELRAWCVWCTLSALSCLGEFCGLHTETDTILSSRWPGFAIIWMCAALVAGFLVGANGGRRLTADPQRVREAATRQLVRPLSPICGSPNAPILLVVFADTTCPSCRSVYPRLRRRALRGEIRLVFRHFPNPFHRGARESAERLETARERGEFWQAADRAFAQEDPRKALSTYPPKSGTTAITLDIRDAKSLNAKGTPILIEVSPHRRLLTTFP